MAARVIQAQKPEIIFDHLQEPQQLSGAAIQQSSSPVLIGEAASLANLAAKMVKIMAACSKVEKAGVNDFHHYNYVKAEDVMAALNSACVDNQVACIPRFSIIGESEKTQRSGQVAKMVTVSVDVYLVDAETGAAMVAHALGTGEDAGDKSVAKAQTMAIKYALMSTCLISTGDDPEADTKTDEENAPVKLATCPKCKAQGYKTGDAEFEGRAVEIYCCKGCKKEFRLKR